MNEIMKLRKWQKQAIRVIKEAQSSSYDRALIAACPGAGKTFFTGEIVTDPATNLGCVVTIVVVPSKALKHQWSKMFRRHFGVKTIDDIDNGTLEWRKQRGSDLYDPARPVLIVTYAQVSQSPDVFAAICARNKTFVVFDEIHHADEDKAFGDSLVLAFTDAKFKLSLSGTPFNTRGGTLAFCITQKGVDKEGRLINKTITDYDYSYGQALRATGAEDDPHVVRPISFPRWKGQVWRDYLDTNGDKTRKIYDGNRESDSLTPYIDAETAYFKDMLYAAISGLDRIRQYQSNAGMLITARDSNHCDQIRDLLIQKGIRDITVVRYDVPGAHEEIERFEKGSHRVLIAIKMISEGVDIKRLRVGVYASNVLTRMFFHQFAGRFIRWDKSIDASQYAEIFAPDHPKLRAWIHEIELMVAESIIQEMQGGEGPERGPEKTIIDRGGSGSIDGLIERGEDFEELERNQADKVRREAGVDLPTGIVIKILRANAGGGAREVVEPTIEESTLSEQNDKLVGKIVAIARNRGIGEYDQYDKVNVAANKAVGIPKKDKLTSDTVLEKRKQFLLRILEGIYPRERMRSNVDLT